ncbi:hypothetical protein H6F42_16650 [Pseudanabaena sp. FACHB-1998]|uniref:hypothetical protein n=1 Tax=Pseudanabaena sp. FACHB-1998 TaxID=2692858 RepID=UPI0016804FED|nr:hypothetical protein [Pseudanabaena sp. FACHB-1998]MBD2178548.1 hypothetical protein [Pseudanabaena sp. FACHB-1998]
MIASPKKSNSDRPFKTQNHDRHFKKSNSDRPINPKKHDRHFTEKQTAITY